MLIMLAPGTSGPVCHINYAWHVLFWFIISVFTNTSPERYRRLQKVLPVQFMLNKDVTVTTARLRLLRRPKRMTHVHIAHSVTSGVKLRPKV